MDGFCEGMGSADAGRIALWGLGLGGWIAFLPVHGNPRHEQISSRTADL
jgi:hypothetical protein